MQRELVCPQHGPYDASLGSCPICSGNTSSPQKPSPLSEDDLPTELGGSYYDDEAPTELGHNRRASGYNDLDDFDPTELGERYRDDVTELDFVDTSMLAILWEKEGNRRGQIHRIKNGSTVGRTEGDVILDDPKVSNPHARFRLEDDKFVIGDMLSKNGTFVNGEQIREITVLEENDVVKIGDSVFVVKFLD